MPNTYFITDEDGYWEIIEYPNGLTSKTLQIPSQAYIDRHPPVEEVWPKGLDLEMAREACEKVAPIDNRLNRLEVAEFIETPGTGVPEKVANLEAFLKRMFPGFENLG